jgi:hypothetical protein
VDFQHWTDKGKVISPDYTRAYDKMMDEVSTKKDEDEE